MEIAFLISLKLRLNWKLNSICISPDFDKKPQITCEIDNHCLNCRHAALSEAMLSSTTVIGQCNDGKHKQTSYSSDTIRMCDMAIFTTINCSFYFSHREAAPRNPNRLELLKISKNLHWLFFLIDLFYLFLILIYRAWMKIIYYSMFHFFTNYTYCTFKIDNSQGSRKRCF